MSALYLLIGISLLVAIGFLCAFLWATTQGQYEDDYTPSVRMLFDNEPNSEKATKISIADDTPLFCTSIKTANSKTIKNKE
jgi:cbb3-type cytochrome oxidase maturation protein